MSGFLYLERKDRARQQEQYLASQPFIWPSGSPYFETKYKVQPSISPTPITYTYASTLDVPPLFPDLTWQEVEKKDSQINKNTMLYVISEDHQFYASAAALEGDEWYALKSNLSDTESYNLQKMLFDYYSNEFSNKNWDYQIQVPGYKLQAIVADGPVGSIWGYVGAKDGLYRLLVVDERFPRVEDRGWSAIPASCPCSINYRIFVTPELTLDEILAKAVKE